MTDFVLTDYSWRRFLDDGILDDDRRPQLQTEFDAFVNEGYGTNACFAAAG
jgi:hypothetical protein